MAIVPGDRVTVTKGQYTGKKGTYKLDGKTPVIQLENGVVLYGIGNDMKKVK